MDNPFAARAGSDRLAPLADVADQAFRAGGRAVAAPAGHDISDAEDDQRQRGGGAIYDVAIDHQFGLRSVDQKQRAYDERRNAAQAEDSIAGDEGFGDQQSDAEKNH